MSHQRGPRGSAIHQAAESISRAHYNVKLAKDALQPWSGSSSAQPILKRLQAALEAIEDCVAEVRAQGGGK